MQPFGFATAARILFGRGKAAEAPCQIPRFGENVFLVHGASAKRAAWLRDGLGAKGARVTTFSCQREPQLDDLNAATQAAAGCDCVVSLGGGAAIDLGKATAAMLAASGPPLTHLEVVGQGKPLDAPPVPFIAIPTTAGTGAEVTKNAVIGVPEQGRKVSLRDDRMLADLAIVDPALTDHTPWNVTLASGLDAITQVVEPYLCNRGNPLTDALCRAAIPFGLEALATLQTTETEEARDAMAYVSLCGGLALANAGLGAVHGLAGVIGGKTDAPHGAVCGALLPHVLQTNAMTITEHAPLALRFAEVSAWVHQATGCATMEGFSIWCRKAGLPNLKDLGVATGDHAWIAEHSAQSSSMKANPVQLTQGQLIGILAKASM